MIPKAIIHTVATEESLRDTTIEKDYVLGWILHGIAVHPLARAARRRPDHRHIFHRYGDAPESFTTIACYSVNEILAEKTRALYERQGRARDVYDVVHICRSFRGDVSPARARGRSLRRNSSSRSYRRLQWTGSSRASTLPHSE